MYTLGSCYTYKYSLLALQGGFSCSTTARQMCYAYSLLLGVKVEKTAWMRLRCSVIKRQIYIYKYIYILFIINNFCDRECFSQSVFALKKVLCFLEEWQTIDEKWLFTKSICDGLGYLMKQKQYSQKKRKKKCYWNASLNVCKQNSLVLQLLSWLYGKWLHCVSVKLIFWMIEKQFELCIIAEGYVPYSFPFLLRIVR